MFNFMKNAVGITEPTYGPSALHSVAEQTKDVPFTELKKDDLAWIVMDSTNVESKSFYMTTDEGYLGLVQVIYSNVLGIRTTAQLSIKIFYLDPGTPHLWASDNVSNFSFSADKLDFKADGCSMELSADGQSYTIKSTVNRTAVVDITFTQSAPGVAVGKNGTTTFGTDPAKPWGRMRHVFWPRCSVKGSIMTQKGPINMDGRGMVSHALQGMKPHFAAAKWNFVNFQSPSYSAVLMNYTTPPSYGESTVTVGAVATDSKILFAGATPTTKIQHTNVRGDADNDWPEPDALALVWEGQGADGKAGSAEITGGLDRRLDRIDVMGELPKFVKQIVAGTAGTKPYIYQFAPKATIKVTVDGETKEEEGRMFMEATFIS